MDQRAEDRDSVNMRTLCLENTGVSCGDLKAHQIQVGADTVFGDMSMQHPWDARICKDWSLSDAGTLMLEDMSVVLEEINASLQKSHIVLQK